MANQIEPAPNEVRDPEILIVEDEAIVALELQSRLTKLGYKAVRSVATAEEALHRMEEAGWVRAKWVTKDTGRRARTYELTALGRKQLAAEESRWEAVTSAVNRVLRMV